MRLSLADQKSHLDRHPHEKSRRSCRLIRHTRSYDERFQPARRQASQTAKQPVTAGAIKVIARSINGANERLLITFRSLSLAYLVIIVCAYVQHLSGMSRLINTSQTTANIHSFFSFLSLPRFVVVVSPLPHYRQAFVIIKSVVSINVGPQLSLGNTLAGGGFREWWTREEKVRK